MQAQRTWSSTAGRCSSWRTMLLYVIVIFSFVMVQDFRFATIPFNKAFPSELSSKSMSANTFHESLAYVHSIITFDRKLQFLHIPKTAGSTIEGIIAPRQSNISWGMCRFPNRAPNHCGSLVPDWFLAFNSTDNDTSDVLPWLGQPSFWHTVPQLFRPHDNPYDRSDVFTVIRDPVDRAVSEYHYKCFAFHKENICKMNVTEFFDKKLQQLNTHAMVKYWADDSHFVPQYEYIFRPLQVRQVDHVLVLNATTIGPDFDRTVKAFGLPMMHWPGSNTRAGNAVNRSKTERDPLAGYMAERIKLFYAEDYKWFSFR